MASSKKTDNYQLNEWVGSDRPHRIDFVNDNLILDKIIKQYKDLIDSQGVDVRNAKKHIESMIHALNQLIADMDKKVPTSEEKAQFQRNALDISNMQQTLAETKAAVDNYTNTNQMMYEFFRKLKEDLRIANVEYFDDDKIIKLHKMDGSIEDINIDNRIINPDKFKAALQVAMQELLKLKEDERLIWTNKELNKKIDDKVKEATRPDIITDDTYTTHTINELLALIKANSKNIEYFETTGDNLGLVKWNKIIELLGDKFTRDNIVAELNKKESTVKDLNLEKDIKDIILNYVLEAIATAEQKNPKTPDDIHKNYDIDDGGKDVQPNKWNKYQILQIITDNINNLLNTYLPTAAEEIKGIITEKRVKELATNVATTLITALGNVVTFSALENWYNTNKYTAIDENTADKLGVTTYNYIKSMIDKYAPGLAEQDKAGLIKLSTIDDKINTNAETINTAIKDLETKLTTSINSVKTNLESSAKDTLYIDTYNDEDHHHHNTVVIANSKETTIPESEYNGKGSYREPFTIRGLIEAKESHMGYYLSDYWRPSSWKQYYSINKTNEYKPYMPVKSSENGDIDGLSSNERERGVVSSMDIFNIATFAITDYLPLWYLNKDDITNTESYGFVNKALIYNIVNKQLSTFTPANNDTLKNILDEYNTAITNIGTKYTQLEDKHNTLDKTVKDLTAKVIKNEDFANKEITGHRAAINGLIDTVNLHTTDISSLASSKLDKQYFANYQVEVDSKTDSKIQTLKTDLETKINKNLLDTTDKYNSIDQTVKSQTTSIADLDKQIKTIDKNKVNADEFNTYKTEADKKIADANQIITTTKDALDKKITDSINTAKSEINNSITTIATQQNNAKDTLYVEYKDDNDKTYPKIVLDKSTETKSTAEGVTRQPLSSVRDIFNGKSLQINVPEDDKNDKLSTLLNSNIVNVFETDNGSDGGLKPKSNMDAYLTDTLHIDYSDSVSDTNKGLVSLNDLWKVSYRASWNVANSLLLNDNVTTKFPKAYGLMSKHIVNKLIDQKLLDKGITSQSGTGTEDTSVFGKINSIKDEISTLKTTDTTIKKDLEEVTNKATINANEIKRVENEYNTFKDNIGKTISDTVTPEITTMKESITTNNGKIKDLSDNKLDKSVFDTYKNATKEELNTKFTTELKPITEKLTTIDDSVKTNTNNIINNAKLTGNTLVLTKADNSTIEVDLTHFVDSFTLPSDLFKNVTLNANKLVFTKQDGTNLEVDLSKFIDQVPVATETVSGTVTTKQIADQISTALAPVVQNLNEVSKNNVTEMKDNVTKLQSSIKELETKLNSLKSADGFTDEDIEKLKKKLNIIKDNTTGDNTSIEDRLHVLEEFKDNLNYTILNNKYKEKYEPLLKLLSSLLAYMKNTIINMPILKMTPKEGSKAPRVVAGEDNIKLFEDLVIPNVVDAALPELTKDNYVQVNKYLDDLIVKYRKYDIAFMTIIKKLSEEYFMNYRDLGIKYYRDLKNLQDGSTVSIGYPDNKEFKHLVYIKPKENESLNNKIKPFGYILGNARSGQTSVPEPDKVSMFTQYIDRYKSQLTVKGANYLNYFEVYSKFGFKEDPFNSAIFNFYNNLDADKLSVLHYDDNKLTLDLMQGKYDKYYDALRNFYTNFAYYISSKTLLLKDKSLWLDQAKLNIPANIQPDTTRDGYILSIDKYYRAYVHYNYKKTDDGDYDPNNISKPGSMKDPTDANVNIAFDGNGITTTFGDWYYYEDPDGDIYDKVAEVFNLKDVIKYYDFVIKQYYEEGVINRSDELWNLFGKLYSIPSGDKKNQLRTNIDMDDIDNEDDSYAHEIIDEVFSNGFLTSQNDLGFSNEQWKKTFDSSKLHTHQDVEQLIEDYKKEFSNPHFDFFRSDLGLFLYPGMILTLARVGLLGPELQHELMTDYPTFTGGNYLTKSERDKLLAKVPEEDIEEYYNNDGEIFNENTVKFRYDFKSDKFIESKSPIDDPSVQDFINKCRNTFLDKAKEILLLIVDLKKNCKASADTYKEAITQYSKEFKTVMSNEKKDIFNFRKFTKNYKPTKATFEEESRDDSERIYDLYMDQEVADGKVIELDTVSIYRDSLFGTVDSKDLQTMIELVKDPAMDNMKSLTYDDVNSTLIYTKGMDEYTVDISPLTSRIPTDYVTKITYDKETGNLHYLLYNGKDIVIELSKIFKFPKATNSTAGILSLNDIANSQTIKDLISKVDKQASAIDKLEKDKEDIDKKIAGLETFTTSTFVKEVTLEPVQPENVQDTDDVLDDKFYKVNVISHYKEAGHKETRPAKLDNFKPLVSILDKKIKAVANNTKIPDNIEERIKKLEDFDKNINKNIDINLISNKLKSYIVDLSKNTIPDTTVTNLTTNSGTKVNTYTFSQKNGTVTTIDMNPAITELTTKVESSVNNITNSVIPQLKTEVTDTIQNKVKEATDNINNNLTTNISNIVNNKIIEAKTEIVNETKSDIKQELTTKGDKYKLEYKNGENGKDDTLTFVKNVYDTSINKYKADDITTIDLPYIKKSNLEMQLNTPNKKVIVIDKDGSSSPAINSKSEYAANINTVDVMLTYKDQNTGTLKLAIPNNKEKPTDLFDEFYIGRQLLGTINFSYTTFWSSNKILKVLAKKLSIFKTEVVEDVKKDLPKPQRVPDYILSSQIDENDSNLVNIKLLKDNNTDSTVLLRHIPNLNINISNTKLNDSQKAQSKDKISSIFDSSNTNESIKNSWFGVDSPQYPQFLKDLYRGDILYNHYIHEPNKNLTDASKDDDSKTYLDLGDNIKLKFNDTNRYVPFEIINKSYKNYYNENNTGPLRVYSNEYIDTIFKAITGSIKHLTNAVERVQYLGVLPRPEIRLDSDLQYTKSTSVTKVDFEQIKNVDIPVTSTTKSSIIKGKSYYILSNVNHRNSGDDKASSELLIPLEFSDRFYMRGGHYNTNVDKDIYSTDGCLEYTRSDDLLDMSTIDRSDYWSEFIDKVATQHMIDTSIQIALKNYTPTDKDPMTTEKLDKQINSVVTLQTNNLISDIKVEPDTVQNNIYTTSYKVKLTQKDGVTKDVKLPRKGVVTRVGVIFDNTDTIKYNKPKADI